MGQSVCNGKSAVRAEFGRASMGSAFVFITITILGRLLRDEHILASSDWTGDAGQILVRRQAPC
jgi:hypothetical protein